MAVEVNRQAYLESVGRRIQARRLALRMSQRRLAAMCGRRQGTISKLERGQLDPSFALLWMVCGALGMSLDEAAAFPAVVPPFPEEDVA
jgi:transcriptional regulator with XRE-family HTH domain